MKILKKDEVPPHLAPWEYLKEQLQAAIGEAVQELPIQMAKDACVSLIYRYRTCTKSNSGIFDHLLY